MSIFEKASKAKLRFATNKGLLTTEDLWDLSLESLDTIAIATDKALETSGKKSFIGKKDTTNTITKLQMEILEHIIEVKIAEKDARATRAAKQAQISKLKEALMEDENKELLSMSKEDKLKMLADLQETE